ncbi:MAG: hypothetical protein ACXW2E_00355 [Nitrososphaeraceae archaeon]
MKNLPQIKISWPDLCIEAESSGEQFKDVRIVTALNEFNEKVLDFVIGNMLSATTINDVDCIIDRILVENTIDVVEKADILCEPPYVCLNVPEINDETIWKAFGLIQMALDNNGVWESPTKLSFDKSQISIGNVFKPMIAPIIV